MKNWVAEGIASDVNDFNVEQSPAYDNSSFIFLEKDYSIAT